MIAVDTNILVYAHRFDTVHNARAYARLSELISGSAQWAIPWACVHEFIGVVTRVGRWFDPTPLGAALDQVEVWRSSPTLELLAEPEEYWAVLSGVATAGRVTGPQIHDARIAAICLSHNVHELWSADRDFSRFPGLRVVNPLTA